MPFAESATGARIYWKLEGRENAAPLVLLNSIGTDMDLWEPALPMLRPHHRLLRIDTRGHGASDVVAGDPSLADLSADVTAVMDAAGIDRAAIAGVSLGGMIAMEMALSDPTRVDRLVLVCTSATMDKAAWADRVVKVRSEGMAAIADLAMGRFLSPEFAAADPAMTATIRRGLLAMDAEGYAACAAAIRDLDLHGRLSAISCPVLVVTGNRDTSTPLFGHGEHLLAAIAGARHVALDAAHLAPLEAPATLSQAIESFLPR